MAIIDVVKHEHQAGEIVCKFPSQGLRWGTRVVVYPGQVAFFAKGGKICDEFKEGTYTLSTNNIPLLNYIVNIPYGGDSPFQADVWFVNLLTSLNYKWGTETPIQLEDPKYKIIVPIRAYGQYGFKISDARTFLEKLSGNSEQFNSAMLQSYFRGILLSNLTNIISDRIISEGVSILEVNSYLLDISNYSKEKLAPYFTQYGVELVDFNIISINVPEGDESLKVLKTAKSTMARLQITGTDTYKMERTFDVLDAAAKNESNGGNMLNAGVGLGAGVSLGSQLLSSGNALLGNEVPPPLNEKYHLAINGQQRGPFTKEQVEQMLNLSQIDKTTLCWKKGMKQWASISSFAEFEMDDDCPPPLPTI